MQLSGPTFPVSCFAIRPASRDRGIGHSVDVWLARREALPEPGNSRTLLRETLSRYAPVAPEDWRFRTGEHGKPEIAQPAQARLRFNLSHSDRLVACAVTLDHDIGVDVENTARACEPLELGERVFTDEENRALRALTGRARQRRFFELWTLKEAWLKARGSGFALDPRCVSFEIGESARIRARFHGPVRDDPAQWSFALLEPEPGQLMALALRTD